jgi:plastocyanin
MVRKPLATFLLGLASAVTLLAGCAAWAPATPSPSPVVVELTVATDTAAGLRYVPDQIGAPAHARVRLTLRNLSTEAHNLTFDAPVSGATRTIVEPGGSDVIDLVTPAPGRYSFVCTIHMEMSGTLTVE